MADFAQPGLICTLQNLNEAHAAEIERGLCELTRNSPIGLILPCHARDLGKAALDHLCAELQAVEWLQEIVVSLNGIGADELDGAQRLFGRLPGRVRLLWNDGAKLSGIYARLLGGSAARLSIGKGFNVWGATGVLAASDVKTVAVQDCDVASFRKETLARLCYATVHPELNFEFAKMYYSRVTDRLYGRVSRLFLAPLLQALVRVAGHHPLLDFLLSFRYPLAGEVAMSLRLARGLPGTSGWGLEIATLCEAFRSVDPREICQVDGGGGYDHKHQPAVGSLKEMAREITSELLTQLAREGAPSDRAFQVALQRAFQREAADAQRRYAALARMNGLPFDAEEESGMAQAFASIITAARLTSEPALPAWDRLMIDRPDEVGELKEAALYTA